MARAAKSATSTPASPRVREEWRARIAAEYGSAAITQHLVLWLIQVGAPPDLIDDGLRIVTDELVHSRLSHETYAAAGGVAPPAIDRDSLALSRRAALPLEHDLLRVAVQVFCLGETVAVPLFKHLREGCTQPTARLALDRILRDEVRHRDFGWTVLDWLLTTPLAAEVPALVGRDLPAMFAGLEHSYGTHNDAVLAAEALPDADRQWGLAPAREYADILVRTYDRDYRPRFTARGIDPAEAWTSRLTATPMPP